MTFLVASMTYCFLKFAVLRIVSPNRKRLTKTKFPLKTYTGEDLKPIGVANVNVQYREKSYDNLPLYVVEKGGHGMRYLVEIG
jgi:hypothetical protein